MVEIVITGPSPERLERARALQSKLLGLIVAAREDYFRVGSPRETSLRFEVSEFGI
ncbi:hypothetical protein OCU04_002032 [Sclerotinia nivalis]|uniref:Uncharacterized protein n=1 Tax=Sclerotinia nivalis TaxID=352851 RepID=A0A9X0DQ19_9HELO|nr:hypothetical protein OCU04_002032 [Sclerotinia nivalis]